MNRRNFIISIVSGTMSWAVSCFISSKVFALGKISKFNMALIKYSGGNYNARPNALFLIGQELKLRTSTDVKLNNIEISLSSPDIFYHPFLILTGDRNFSKFTKSERERLKTFLETGGFLLIDNTGMPVPSKSFDEAVRNEISLIFPNNELKKIPTNHVLYRCFYKIMEPTGRTVSVPYLEGVFLHDRLCLVYSQNDITGAWSRDGLGRWEYEVIPGGEKQREIAVRLGINIIMYSLCLDYKDDQVHVDYLIKKRNWKIQDFK